jgi:hypothetical protein
MSSLLEEAMYEESTKDEVGCAAKPEWRGSASFGSQMGILVLQNR